VYSHLTGREFLSFIAGVHSLGLERAEALIREFRIPAETLISDMSYGTMRKVSIAGTMLHGPRLLLLDEPFNALDIASNAGLQSLILELKQHGCAVVVASHYLPALDRILDRALILGYGGKYRVLTREDLGQQSLEGVLMESHGMEGNTC